MSKGPYSQASKHSNPNMDASPTPPPAYPDLPPTPPASDTDSADIHTKFAAETPNPDSTNPSSTSDPFSTPEDMQSKFAAEAAAFSILNQLDRKEGEAVGILYCSSCGQYFGNVKHLQRHFMFSRKHGEEPRQLRDLYYKLWGNSWRNAARQSRDGEVPIEGDLPPAYSEAMEVEDDGLSQEDNAL